MRFLIKLVIILQIAKKYDLAFIMSSDSFNLLKTNVNGSVIVKNTFKSETGCIKYTCLSKCSLIPLCESVTFDSSKTLCLLFSSRFENDNKISDEEYQRIYLKKRSFLTGEVIQIFNPGFTCWNFYLLKNGLVACASTDSQIKIWNTYENRIEKVFIGHTHWATRIIELTDGSLASGSTDTNVIIWKSDTNQAKLVFSNNHREMITGLAELKNGLIASGSFIEMKCNIWNYTTGQIVYSFYASYHIMDFSALPNGLLAIALNNGYIELWNVSSQSSHMMLNRGSGVTLKMGLLGNDLLIASSNTGKISAFNLTTYQRISYFQAHSQEIRGLKVLKNGYVASGSLDTSIKIWNVFTGELIKTLSLHSYNVVDLELTENGYLVSSSWDSSGSNFPPIKICYP